MSSLGKNTSYEGNIIKKKNLPTYVIITEDNIYFKIIIKISSSA